MRYVIKVEKNGQTEQSAFYCKAIAMNVLRAFQKDPECKAEMTVEADQ